MHDYHVVLQVELSLRARNKAQALERAQSLQPSVTSWNEDYPRGPRPAKWKAGDIETWDVTQVEKID
mgnify:CR=1 FL=1